LWAAYKFLKKSSKQKPGIDVSADQGSVAAGRDIRDTDINLDRSKKR